MNDSESGAHIKHCINRWLTSLQATGATLSVTLPRTLSGTPLANALAGLASEALQQQRSLLIVTNDDLALADISNALELSARPLCLVLPSADYVCRIALRATLALLKSRLARSSDDTEGPVWAAQREQLAQEDALWRACLAWSGRDLDAEPWPADMEKLFPVRVLPIALAKRLAVPADWVVLLDAALLSGPERHAWPGAQRTLLLEEPRARKGGGPLVKADPGLRQRAELALLTQELAELELELATAQAEIAEFTRNYHYIIGSRLAQLDALHAELAQRRAAANPRDNIAAEEAAAAQGRAEESARENQRFAEFERAEPPPFVPTGNIKKLYRQVAQKIHPDRARNEPDRAWRTQLMTEANRAYRAGDEQALHEVMALWQEGAWRETAQDADKAAAAPAQLERQVARLKRRIASIESELNQLFGSRLYELFTAANIARRAGRNLLREMAERLQRDIEQVQAALNA